MVSGPYRSGSTDPKIWSSNLRKMNDAAYEVMRKGHVPIIGVNMALPIIEAAGAQNYEDIMMPMSLRLAERCDAILRMGGASKGADEELEQFQRRGLKVFHQVDEIPEA